MTLNCEFQITSVTGTRSNILMSQRKADIQLTHVYCLKMSPIMGITVTLAETRVPLRFIQDRHLPVTSLLLGLKKLSAIKGTYSI